MAKALARPRGRQGSGPERERELKRLWLSICDDTGFRLYASTYDQPKRRDELIARLSSKAKAVKVRVTRLDIVDTGPETSLVGLLRAHLQEAEPPAGWRRAVMVTGIEQRLDYSSGRKGVAFLHQANLLRDSLPEAAPVPVVFWLSRLASAAMQAEAPDLWDWRAASFDFTGDAAPRLELLRELTTLQLEDKRGLSTEQRSTRFRMLEDLLAELERKGPTQTKRQAAERAALLLEVGIEAKNLGHSAESLQHIQAALTVYREISSQEGEALALRMLASAWQHRGELRRAIEYHQQHLAVAHGIGDRREQSMALSSLGDVWAQLREPHRAIEYYLQALAVFREIGDRRGEGRTLGDLGGVYAASGESLRAMDCFGQALMTMREIGDRRGEAKTLCNLGSAYAKLGGLQRAVEHHEQALVIAREIGDRRGEGKALGLLGAAYANLGEVRRAIGHYEESLAIAHEIGNRWAESATLNVLALAYVTVGEPQRAIEQHEKALVISREVGDRLSEGNVLFYSASVFEQLGERREAIRRMEEALQIYEQIEHPLRDYARATLEAWQAGKPTGEAQGRRAARWETHRSRGP